VTQLKENLNDSGSTLTQRACDSDSTKTTRAHHWSLLTLTEFLIALLIRVITMKSLKCKLLLCCEPKLEHKLN